jgi:hypothetical protein
MISKFLKIFLLLFVFTVNVISQNILVPENATYKYFVGTTDPSLGWTFNFASPYSFITLGLVIAITIFYIIFIQ